MGTKAKAFVVGVIVVGAAVVGYSGWDVVSRPLSAAWLLLLGLTFVTGYATLRIPSMPISFSISDTFSIIAALVVGPSAGAITAAIDGLVLSYRMESTRRTPVRVLFNMAEAAIAIWAAAQAFLLLGGSQPLAEGPVGALRLLGLLTVFGAVNFLLNTGLVATAIGFERNTSVFAIWRGHFVSLWVTHLGGVFASMLMMVLSSTNAGRAPIGKLEVLILIAPLPVILYATFWHALGRAADQIAHLGGMNQIYVSAIEALAQAIDAKDQVTHDHIRRVQDNSVRLARELNVNDDLEIQALKAASLLHDVGKISVPEHILNKPGRLSPSEFEIMQKHAPVGADILSVIGFPYPVEPIVRHHHENWDGTGYPDKISGEQIPIGARILSVVDCFDALTSDRPYRPALSDQDALKIIVDRRGTMYDPRVVDAFLALHAVEKFEVESQATRSTTPVADPHAAPMPADEPPPAPAAAGRMDLEVFYAIGRAVPSDAGIAEIGDAIWQHLHAQIGAAAFVLLSYEGTSDSLAPAYRAGDNTIAADTRIRLGDRLSGWVAATRQSILNSDARLDLDAEVRDDSRLRTALAVPICADDVLLGVLAFYSDRPAAFTPHHQQLAEAAAHIASLHIVHSTSRELVAPRGR